MAPVATTTTTLTTAASSVPIKTLQKTDASASSSIPAPLLSSHTLDNEIAAHLTPAIGTQFKESFQLSSILDSPEKIRDLAILVAQRGVCFFRDQDIEPNDQVKLGQALGLAGGKPKHHGLHIHPLPSTFGELGEQIAVIDEKFNKDQYDDEEKSEHASLNWHSDITFEPVPSDFAILKLHTLPPQGGGDTLWASAYAMYDKLSLPMRELLSGLTAMHHAPTFQTAKRENGFLFRGEANTDVARGAEENRGGSLTAVHPVIRTNPVTGWNGVFVNKAFTKKINGLKKDESDFILDYLYRLNESHDLQVRFRWEKNSLAIWDNRTTLHCATNDYHDAPRSGNRVVSVGERPYYDPLGLSRSEALRDAAGQR